MTDEREKLITRRTEAGLTQRELAERMDISQPFLAQFESGKKNWPPERIAQAHAELDFWMQEPTPDERAAWKAQMQAIIDRIHEEDP